MAVRLCVLDMGAGLGGLAKSSQVVCGEKKRGAVLLNEKQDRVRVLFVEISNGTGGSANSLMRILPDIVAHGIHARVVCGTTGGHLQHLELARTDCVDVFPDGNSKIDPVHRLGPVIWPTRYAIRFFHAVSRQIKMFDPHVVYCNNTIYSHAPTLLAARLARCPAIIHLRDTVTLTTLERKLVPWVGWFVTLSDAALVHYTAEGIPTDRLVRIYDGIDLAAFDRKAAQTPLEKRTGPVIGIIGSLVERKGHRFAMHALARLASKHPNARLQVAGDGPLREQLGVLADNLGMADRVDFLGYLENIPAFLKGVNVCVLPSLREGLPNVAHESMAAGIPFVVSDLPGIREVVADGVTGYVVPPGDVSELARALGRLLDDSERARRMGRAARERLEQGAFSAKEEAREVAALIRELVR